MIGEKKSKKYFGLLIVDPIFALPTTNKWRLSSAGSEHLPYKQRVTGSNPVASTKNPLLNSRGFFILYTQRSIETRLPRDMPLNRSQN